MIQKCSNVRTAAISVARELAFANDSQPDRLESAITGALWEWAFASEDVRRQIAANGSELSVCVECYLSELLKSVAVTRSKGTWCDGVLEQSIFKLSRLELAVAGACFCPNEVAPFEIVFHFAKRRDLVPLRTVFCFGDLRRWERSWRIQEAQALVQKRPRKYCDWLVAVELTPEEA